MEGLESRELPALVLVEPPVWWSQNSSSGTENVTRVGVVYDAAGGAGQNVLVQFGSAGWVRLLSAVEGYQPSDFGVLPSPTAPNAPGPAGDSPGNVASVGGMSLNPLFAATRTILIDAQTYVTLGFQVDATRPEVASARPAPGTNFEDKRTPESPRPEPEPTRSPTESLARRPTPTPTPAPTVVARVAPETGRTATPHGVATGAPVAPAAPAARPDQAAAGSPVQQPAATDAPRLLRGTPSPSGPATDSTAPPSPARPTPDARPAVVAATDGALLRRFATDRDQAAFTELVQRHARSVLAVSTRVLGDADRALDASQVTFAALARRAAVLDDRGSLAGWLHQVARRMALRLRATAARQRKLEQIAAEFYEDADDTLMAVEREDVFRALREELERLPDKYRLPLTLCYLDGLTHAEVGQSVGLPRGSVAKRIGEGLSRLRDRLADRGFLT